MTTHTAQLNPQSIAAALGGKATGNRISAPAPGHSKRDRSLSVLIDPSAPEGFVVYPWAGEEVNVARDYVRRTAGLPEWTPDRKEQAAPTAHLKLVKTDDAPKKFHDRHMIRDGFKLVATYDYASADGELLFQVLRYEHATEPKQFLQRRPDGNSGWFFGRLDPIIYRWPDIAARSSDPIYIVEGEKDCDRLADLGLLATTAPNGSWPEDLSPLKGRTLYVIPDNDAAGNSKAEKIIGLMQGFATVRRVELPDLPDKGDVSDWLDAGNTVEQLQAVARAAKPIAANQNQRFTIDWFGDIEDSLPKETFIKGVLGVNEFTMLSGKPGTGKSVIVTDMACHVAAGMEWHGRRVKQGLVVYIAAERKDLTKRRMLAFRKRHGVGRIPLVVLGGRIDLTSSVKDAEELAAIIKQAELDCGQPCVWIIIDTLTRAFGPGDQNASKDMTKFIQACDTLREAVTGSHLKVIHHTGWAGDRGKGAIDLDGAVDASFMVKKEAGAYVLECDGTNDGDEGVITHFRMEGVQVGVDEDGEPTMAPVVIPADGKTAGEHLVASMSKHNTKAFDVLADLCGDTGEHVAEDSWRASFYAAYPGDKTSALKVRFQRVRKHLIEAGTVFHNDGMYWVSSGT
ncbi:AAA family ATPase [Rhizobium sp. SAFR-030]|uniref:AAA family ATPase n=1 Tax=Rhizobium sp. SAFR-030 TaxID=3387277 RepID=UPI003F7DC8AD